MKNSSVYRPLDVSKQEIRLIEFHHRECSNGGVDSYSLVHASLQDELSFSALSYVWGDPHITENIIVDDVEFAVTLNLAAALKHAKTHWTRHHCDRDPASFRLWADAICINQQDVTERNQQVQIMATLYSRAELVIAWLGESTAMTERAFRTFEFVWKEASELSREEFCALEWLEKHPLLCMVDTESSYFTQNDHWEAAINLLYLPYWDRVWIYQEAVMATTLLFCAGKSSLYYSKMELVISRLSDVEVSIHHRIVSRPQNLSEHIWTFLGQGLSAGHWVQIRHIHEGKLMVKKKLQRESLERDDIWAFASYGRMYRATDPKDHIYGLMSIVDTGLTPDYSDTTSVGQVYREYIDAWLKDYRTTWTIRPLTFFIHAGIGLCDNPLGLPTWAPNYPELSQKNCSKYIFEDTADFGVFAVSNYVSFIEIDLLVVEAVELDTICRTERVPARDNWCDGSLLAYIIDFVNRHTAYKSGIPPLQAVLRAIKFDTSTDVKDNLVQYAYNMLTFLLPCDPEHRKRSLESLESLGLAEGQAFNAGFPKCFYPEQSISDRGWWEEFNSQTSGSVLRNGGAQFFTDIAQLSNRSRFCETTDGYFGLAPLNTRPGDVICVVNGYGAPVILRKENEKILFVGACFIVGLMNGEAKEVMEARGLEVQTLKIS
jgi:hypothetical protein